MRWYDGMCDFMSLTPLPLHVRPATVQGGPKVNHYRG